MEGQGTQAIAKDYGLTRALIEHHRASGHAASAINKAILAAGTGTPLSELATVAIASKVERVRVLDRLVCRILAEIESKAIGELSPKLVDSARGLLETAAKEMGEWRPDGGEKAESATRLAQSIVIHSAAVAGVLGADSATSRNVEDHLSIDAQVVDITNDSGSSGE